MTIYDEMQKIARDLLRDPDFSQGAMTLVQIVPGAGPADDPGPATEIRHVFEGSLRGVKASIVQAGLAQASDLQMTMPVIPGVVPTARDFAEVDGVRYKVVQVIGKPAAGTPVVYAMIIRK